MCGVVTAATVVSAGAAVHSAKKSREAIRDAANTQTAAANQGIEFQREALDQLRGDLSPYSQFGLGAMDQFGGMMGIQSPSQSGRLTPDQTGAIQRQQDSYRSDLFDPSGGQTFDQFSQGMDDEERKKIAQYENAINEFQIAEQSGDPETVRQAQMILEGAESQLPISHLSNINAITPMGQQRQSNYFDEVGVPRRQYGPEAQAAGMAPGMPSSQAQDGRRYTNPLLEQAISERQSYDPLNNSLLSQSFNERQGFDPLSNPLLSQAMEETQAYDPSKTFSPQLLQNPLLRAMQDDVSRRLMNNQAARGKLGSGGTAEALQNALIPQALNFGMQMDQMQRQGTADRARLGGVAVGLQDAAISGRQQAGLTLDELQQQAMGGRQGLGMQLEDVRQRDISNLYDVMALGQASAARQGAAGQSAAANMGNLAQSSAQAQANSRLGQAQAHNQMVGGLVGAGLYGLGGMQRSPAQANPGQPNPGTYNVFQPTTGQFNTHLGMP